jgi:glycosyltransferase involved in cell wall biosynthesis
MFGGSVENYVIRRTGLIFTVPGSFTEVLQRIRGRSKGIVELPQPIPAEFFSIPKVHRESGKELVVGYVGTVDAIHSVATILQAVSSVQQDLPNVRLLLACDGDPRCLSKITNMMKSLGLRASVMLRVPNSRMPAVYKSLDLLLAPSSELLRDVVTLKVIEAIAERVPFLAQKGKAMSALLRDSGVEHTVLVDRDDPSVWAQRIKALLLDSDLRRSVAARTFEFLRSPIECHTERAVANVFLASLAEYESENNT